MLKTKTVKYVEWNNFKEEVCKEMKLDPALFRDYHKVIGGDYKDLWHVWLWWNEDKRITNGVISPVTFDSYMEWDDAFWKVDLEEAGYGTWAIPFLEAVETVVRKHGDKRGTLYIEYKW